MIEWQLFWTVLCGVSAAIIALAVMAAAFFAREVTTTAAAEVRAWIVAGVLAIPVPVLIALTAGLASGVES